MKKSLLMKNKKKYYTTMHDILAAGGRMEDVARAFQITRCTLYRWIKEFPELQEIQETVSTAIAMEVEGALLKRALGYRTEKQVTRITSGKEQVIIITTEVPPNVSACIFWLTNRAPKRWKHKPESVEEQNIVLHIHESYE